MRRFLTLFVMLMLSGVLAFAQNRVVTGRVTDDQGNPVSFATVTETSTKNAVTADANGYYSIRLRGTGGITVTAAGYVLATSSAAGTTANVTLNRNTAELSTVVVTTALGQQRQAKELGYSTAKIRGGELTQAKVVNLQNGLTGKVSGLNVQTTNSGVFADTRITLRGIRSLTGNNQPMLVVDGVPIALGYISSINPNDIQDVTILKSASSTAVYGPDGVNGAIVITTKRGNKSKPVITFSHTIQAETVSFMPKFQTTFGSGSSVDIYGQGVYDPIENQTYGDMFDGSRRPIGRPMFNPALGRFDTLFTTYSARPEEKRKFWNTGITNQTDLSFSAGNFYVSGQNVDIKGIEPGDENHRQSIHLSSANDFNKFRVSFSLNYTHGNYNVNAGQQFGNGRDYTPYWDLINTPIEIPLTQFKNWRNDFWSSPNNYFNDYYYNPYWILDNFRSIGSSNDLFGNLELNLKATSWLNFTYRLGGTVTDGSSKATQGAWTYSLESKASHKSAAQSGDIPAAVQDASATSSRLSSEFFATIKQDLNKWHFDALLGHSYRESVTKSVNVSSNNLGIPGVYNVVVRKGEPGASESNSRTRLQRFFGRLSIGYNNWAFAEVTGSYDMDSRLANPYNYKVQDISYFYPGASVSILLSEAIRGLKGNRILSYAKLRGAISKTGNVNLGAYSLENTFSPGTGFPFGTLLGFSANDLARLASYKPEFVVNNEAGIELGFLRNKINFEGTWYVQDNTNQIITAAYSAATGYPNALLNAASFKNRGIELDLRLTPLIKIRNVTVDFKANYTHQTNKVYYLIEGVNELGIGNGNYVIKGYPAYTFKLTDYVKDSLGRVIVDAKTGYPTVNNVVQTFGQTTPKDILGLSMNINYKGLSFAAVADYRGGNEIYSGALGSAMDFAGVSYRSGLNNRQPFIFPNSVYLDASGKYVPNTSVYMQSGGYDFWSTAKNTGADANYLSSGAFWKLREVSLSYTLPDKVFSRTKIIKAAVVTLSGRNLVTWIPKTNQWTDPEFSNTTGNAQGVSSLTNIPPTRIYGINLTLQF